MNYVESFNLLGVEAKQIPSITGNGAPTTATEGAVGCLYMDTATGDMYKCTVVSNGTYTWVLILDKNELVEDIIGEIDAVNVVQTIGDSETEVMSQRSVTNELSKTNTELIDIRVGTDGTVYDNAGKAIREQFKSFNEKLDVVRELSESPAELSWADRPYYDAGGVAKIYSQANSYRAGIADVSQNIGKSITVHTVAVPSQKTFIVDENYNILATYATKNGNYSWQTIDIESIPEGAKYIIINCYDYPNNVAYVDGLTVPLKDKVIAQGEEISALGVEVGALSEEVAVLANGTGEAKVVLPATIVGCSGKQLDIVFQNIVRHENPADFNAIYSAPFTNCADRLTLAASALTDTFSLTGAYIDFYRQNTLTPAIHRLVKYKWAKTTDGSGTKKVLFIGDSITAQGTYIYYLQQLFNADENMSIELLGTKNTAGKAGVGAGVPCEGRGGWSAYEYCNNTSFNSDTNPFLNNGVFDFSYYMSQNGFDGVDMVFINLGTNDVTRGKDNVHYTEMINCYQTMINSIKAYNANVKIFLWLPPTRALAHNSTRQRIDQALLANEALIAAFDEQQSNNIYLVPTGMVVDPYKDYLFEHTLANPHDTEQVTTTPDNTHPYPSGHAKIADLIYGYIKYYTTN